MKKSGKKTKSRKDLLKMSKKKRGQEGIHGNLLEISGEGTFHAPLLEKLKLDNEEKFIVAFTIDFEICHLHYCAEPDINNYVRCNSPDGDPDGCTLCELKKNRSKMYLLPVVNIQTKKVEVLPISSTITPQALLPQLSHIVNDNFSVVISIIREMYVYNVNTHNMDGEIKKMADRAIEKYNKQLESGKIKALSSVYPTLTNGFISKMDEFAWRLKIKRGVGGDDD